VSPFELVLTPAAGQAESRASLKRRQSHSTGKVERGDG
jgi:hypothetical protein